MPNPWEPPRFFLDRTIHQLLAPRRDTLWNCPLGGELAWEAKDVFNPSATRFGGKVALLYRAEDEVGPFAGTSRVGLALSEDGVHFDRLAEPVLYPDHDAMLPYEQGGGCEDPRVHLREDGTYILTYTAYNGELARLAVASSRDLRSWTKHGLAFGPAYQETWSKAGSIVCERLGDDLIMKRLDGRYWMLWGESDIHAACSEDGIHWEPVLRAGFATRRLDHSVHPPRVSESRDDPRLLSVVRPRSHRFDSQLVEPGPPPIWTPDGIGVIYNACNAAPANGDPEIPAGGYLPGYLVLDALDPTSVVWRCSQPMMQPNDPRMKGQMPSVVFVQGMAFHNGQPLLYPSMGDSTIGLARPM